jgi:hypothetical protein
VSQSRFSPSHQGGTQTDDNADRAYFDRPDGQEYTRSEILDTRRESLPETGRESFSRNDLFPQYILSPAYGTSHAGGNPVARVSAPTRSTMSYFRDNGVHYDAVPARRRHSSRVERNFRNSSSQRRVHSLRGDHDTIAGSMLDLSISRPLKSHDHYTRSQVAVPSPFTRPPSPDVIGRADRNSTYQESECTTSHHSGGSRRRKSRRTSDTPTGIDLAWPPRGFRLTSSLSQDEAEELVSAGAPVFAGRVVEVPHTKHGHYNFFSDIVGEFDGESDVASWQSKSFGDMSLPMIGSSKSTNAWDCLEKPAMMNCFGTGPGTVTLNYWVSISGSLRPNIKFGSDMKPRKMGLLLILERLRVLEQGIDGDVGGS